MNQIQRLLGLLILISLTSCDPAKKTTTTLRDDNVIEIVFLQMNDVYEISPLSDNSGGVARVATLRKSLLAKNPNTFTVLAGDFISPSVIGTLKYEKQRIRGKQMVEALNALGLDWVIFGNHEFDYDLEDLQARLDESNFTWLAANARQKSGDQLRPFAKNRAAGAEPCPDHILLEVKDADGTSIRLAVFGVLITSGQKDFVQYSDPLEVAKQQYAELRDKSDICLALTHLDIDDDKKLAALLPNIPLIMGGHDHENMMHKVGNTVVAKADANARTVYVHTLRYDKKKGTSTVKSELRRIDEKIPNDPATATVVAKWEKIKESSLASSGFDATKKVMELKAPLDCREAIVRKEQAPVGQMITAAMLAAGKHQPECAILNGGSIRVDDILKGTLTELDIVRMLPFGGGISEVEMQGSLLKRTLDAGLANKGNGGWLHWGQIARDESINNWRIGGAPLNVTKTYRVMLPEFLLTGLESRMDFLKTERVNDTGNKTSNPDISVWYRADSNDKSDVRSDIRLALIKFLREGGE